MNHELLGKISQHVQIDNNTIATLKNMPVTERNFWRERLHYEFTCNICSTKNKVSLAMIDRESTDCQGCQSYVRMRTMVHLLSKYLFDRSLPLEDFPKTSKVGVGLSDWDGYALRLAKIMPKNYQNTFYDQEPKIDINILDEKLKEKYDFLLTTDVFEHTNPPADTAFKNSFQMLKKGGALIFSVPFTLNETTQEHFPNLFNFEIQNTAEGKKILINKTRDGRTEYYSNLIFHGAAMGGDALEKRVYSEKALRKILSDVGFSQIIKADETYLPHGIIWWNAWSTFFVAIK